MVERRRRKGALLRSSYFWKSYIGYAILLVVSSAVVAIAVERQLSASISDQVDSQLKQHCQLLAVFAPYGELGESQSTLKIRRSQLSQLKADSNLRLSILAINGKILADSHLEAAQLSNQMSRPEIQSALSNWSDPNYFAKAIRPQKTLAYDEIYMARAITQKGRLLGFARVSQPLTVLSERQSHLRQVIFLSAGLAIIFGLACGIYVARWVSSPLITVASLVVSFLEEEEEDRIAVKPGDEITLLTVAFKSLSRTLKRRMRKIVRRRREMSAIFDGMVEGVIAIDTDEKIVHINEVAARFFQIDVNEAKERKIWECTRSPQLLQTITNVLDNGEKQRVEWSLATSKNEERIIEVSVAPFEHEGEKKNQIAGAVLLFYDVSNVRKLEAMRREFMANVSHELKTPITAVRGILETCLDDPEMPVSIRERFLRKADKQTDRLEKLVSDLIELSKVESKQRNLKTQIVDLRDVIYEVLQRLSPVADQKSINVEMELSEHSLTVCGDGEALEQLVGNLVSNAIKYSGEGTDVFIRAERRESLVRFSVKDQGPGIDSAHQKRIFERFYRVDAARSREAGGTGLGLSIVKHIVRVLDGEVWVESKRGEGAMFILTLPFATELPTS